MSPLSQPDQLNGPFNYDSMQLWAFEPAASAAVQNRSPTFHFGRYVVRLGNGSACRASVSTRMAGMHEIANVTLLVRRDAADTQPLRYENAYASTCSDIHASTAVKQIHRCSTSITYATSEPTSALSLALDSRGRRSEMRSRSAMFDAQIATAGERPWQPVTIAPSPRTVELR
jgi:hypothetical protein